MFISGFANVSKTIIFRFRFRERPQVPNPCRAHASSSCARGCAQLCGCIAAAAQVAARIVSSFGFANVPKTLIFRFRFWKPKQVPNPCYAHAPSSCARGCAQLSGCIAVAAQVAASIAVICDFANVPKTLIFRFRFWSTPQAPNPCHAHAPSSCARGCALLRGCVAVAAQVAVPSAPICHFANALEIFCLQSISSTFLPRACLTQLRTRLRTSVWLYRGRRPSCGTHCVPFWFRKCSKNFYFQAPILGTPTGSKPLPRACLKQLRARLRTAVWMYHGCNPSCGTHCCLFSFCECLKHFDFQVPILVAPAGSKSLTRACSKQLRARLRAPVWMRCRFCPSCGHHCFRLRFCKWPHDLYFKVRILGTQRGSTFVPRACLKQLCARLRAGMRTCRRCRSSCGPHCFHLQLRKWCRNFDFLVPILRTPRGRALLPRACLKQLRVSAHARART